MPDPLENEDFSAFIRTPTPLVPPATSPVIPPVSQPAADPLDGADPLANEDFSSFLRPVSQPLVPVAPPVPQSTPQSRSVVDQLMVPDAPVAEYRDPASLPPSMDQLKAEWSQLQSEIAGAAGSPVDYSGVPKTFAEYAVSRLSPFNDPLKATALKPRGMGGAFAADLTSGVQRLGSMIARGQLAPDHALEAQIQAEEAQFLPRTFGEKVTGGLGGSLPALATIAATRGRTMPAVTGTMAVPLEAGGASFVQGMAQPGRTPEQNISGSLIEALMTRAGGAFEPGFGTPLAKAPVQVGKEGLEEGATGGLGEVSDQINSEGFAGDVDWARVGESAAVEGVAGSLASSIMGAPGAARELVTPTPEPVAAPVEPESDLRPELELETDPQDHADFDAIESVNDDAPVVENPIYKVDPEGRLYGEISDEDAQKINDQIDREVADSQAREDFEKNQARTVLDPEVIDPDAALQDVVDTQELPAVAAARYDVEQAKSLERGDEITPPTPKLPDIKPQPIPPNQEETRLDLKPVTPKTPKSRDIETRPEPREAFNVDQGVIDYESPQAQVPAETPATRAQQPSTPSVAPAASPASSFPAPKSGRGSLKGQFVERRFFGPTLKDPKKMSEVPKGFVREAARVVKDGGFSQMDVKPLTQGLFLMQHPGTGKVMIGRRTDDKGRLDDTGYLRPLDQRGEVTAVDESLQGLKFDTVEDAVRFAGKNFVKDEVDQSASDSAEQEIGSAESSKDAGLNVRQGKNIGVTKKPATQVFEVPKATPERTREDKQKRLKFLADKATRGSMTDEELDEADALEAEMAKAPEPEKVREFRAVPNSPLTPKLRQELADTITPDMPPKNAGIIVKNVLEQALRREPTQNEVLAALRDLKENGVIESGVAPGKSVDAGANQFFAPLVNAVAKIAGVSPGGYLRQRFSDLSSDNQAIAELESMVKPGQFGYTPYQISKFVTKMLGVRGRAQAWITDTASKLGHLFTARTVAALFPAFRPVLRLAQSQIDKARLAFQDAFDKLAPFRNLPEASRFRVNGALIQFRLEDRDPKDFAKPLTYTDEQGRQHQYTLTPREQGVVESIFRTNRAVLQDYLDVLRMVFKIPASVATVADLTAQIAAGNLPPSAKILENPMRILETGKDNYVPLKRYGDKYHAVIYDAAKFNAARTKAQRKAAELGFLKAESNADLNRQIADAGQKFPNAYILAYEDRQHVVADQGSVTAKQLLELADVAGVPPAILQDFLDAGVENYLETRGIGARFAKAEKVPGFNHDMLRAEASHLQAMTQATERLRHRHLMELSTKQIKDPELKRFAQRFMERIDTPVGQLAQGVRQLTTLYFLGLGAVSALVNSTTSLFTQPAVLFAATRNPVAAARSFGNAVREQFNALTHIFGNGLPGVGRGVDQVEQAASRYNRSDPKLAEAIREAGKAGVFTNVFEREADEIAKRGEESGWSKTRTRVSQGLMHFFAKVETANRLAAFIGGYHAHEENSGLKGFTAFADNLGFSPGGTSAEFAEFFSDFNNFRMDKTDMPSWAQGTFSKNAQGQEAFNPSGWRPMAYSLKGWAVNFLQQQLLVLRAALKGGWIDRSLYAGLLVAFLTTFGSVNMVPGLQTLDAIDKKFSGDLQSTSENVKESGTLGRVLVSGWPGLVAEYVAGEQVGDNIDMLMARSGAGNVIPSGVDPMAIFAPLSVADGMAQGMSNLGSGDTEKMREGAGQILGKEATRLARGYNQLTGNRGYTTKSGNTLVPSEETAKPGAPFLSTGDIINGVLGGQPPVVREAYRQQQMVRDMKTSNDAVMEYAVTRAADAVFRKDKAGVKEAVQTVKDWNIQALNNKEPWKVISGDAFEQSLIMEIQARSLGARNLRPVPKGGRQRYLQEFEDETPDENIKSGDDDSR